MHAITAAVSRSPGAPLTLESLALEPPRADEALVRVAACGICHTDLAMRDSADRVPRPIVLGHEGAGVVERVGSAVRGIQPGDHVLMSFASCGHCSSCDGGMPAYCRRIGPLNFGGCREDGSVALAGAVGSARAAAVHSHFFGQSAFATHALCAARNLVVVPRDLPLELLAPLGCGLQTGAGAVLRSFALRAGASLVVLGVGAVGLAAVMAARVAGAAAIVGVDLQPERLALARELGATHAVAVGADGGGSGLAEALARIAPEGFDFVLDTTGSLDAIRAGIGALGVRGVCGLVSSARGKPVPLDALALILGGRTVRGIHQGDSVPREFIPQLLDLYRHGAFPIERLVRRYPFERIADAMADLAEGRVIKPVLRMEPTSVRS